MTQAERLQELEHQLQVLSNKFGIAADRGRDHGNHIHQLLTRIEKNLNIHIAAAKDGYRMLNKRVDANNQRILALSKLTERIRTATTTPCPDPESATPEKHLLPNREPSPINIDVERDFC